MKKQKEPASKLVADAEDQCDGDFLAYLQSLDRAEISGLVSKKMEPGHRLYDAFSLCADVGQRLNKRRADYGTKQAQTCIYAVQYMNRVKIGIATNPRKRLAALRCQIGANFDNIAIFPFDTPRVIERSAHSHFSNRRGIGEWFEITFTEACNFLNTAHQTAKAA